MASRCWPATYPRTELQAAGSLPAEGVSVSPDPVAARQDLDVAEATQLLAAAEVTEVEHRAQAWRAVWQNAEQPARAETHATAVRALRRKAVATAGHALAVARRDQQRATADRAAAAATAVTASTEALSRAESALHTDIDPATPLSEFIGARWTPTRFFSSGTDDPAPKFLPQLQPTSC